MSVAEQEERRVMGRKAVLSLLVLVAAGLVFYFSPMLLLALSLLLDDSIPMRILFVSAMLVMVLAPFLVVSWGMYLIWFRKTDRKR